MSTGGSAAQTVGSVTIVDSNFSDTQVAIRTAHTDSSSPATGGSLMLDNVSLTNVPTAVAGPSGTILAGGSVTIPGWGQGHQYIPHGPLAISGVVQSFARPASLTSNGKFYVRSKPQYNNLPLSSFVSARTAGAQGDGKTDDTVVINELLEAAAAAGQVVFFDAGTYLVTSTIYIPPGSKIVGESYSVIMGSGAFFSSIDSPEVVVSVGKPNQSGSVEWSDMIVSTQGATAGAILIEWNLAAPASSPSGMWDVHTRIGGFAGSNLQLSNCPTTPTAGNVVNPNCIAAFASILFTFASSGVYLENTWFWVADHDIDDPNSSQITIYAGRGLYCNSHGGTLWLVGTAVEHHALYQYQFFNTKDVFAGQIQTETAYYQPNPPATAPFAANQLWNDYNFERGCTGVTGNCAMGWGLRVVNSMSMMVYGAGLYSFFDNYSTCKSSVIIRSRDVPS
jgi:glucan 1,3-beta-glucosidase